MGSGLFAAFPQSRTNHGLPRNTMPLARTMDGSWHSSCVGITVPSSDVDEKGVADPKQFKLPTGGVS